MLVGALVLWMAVPAWAHTEFESSTPSDQESVDAPVSEIQVVFTLPVTIVGNGFEILDPQGNVVSPSVETEDDATFTLVLAEPLAGGEVGVRYEVTAQDGHVLAGGFSFTVTASAPVATTTIAMDPTNSTTNADDSSSMSSNATSDSTSTTASGRDDEPAGTFGLWLGLGVVVVGGLGIYAGFRSRS